MGGQNATERNLTRNRTRDSFTFFVRRLRFGMWVKSLLTTSKTAIIEMQVAVQPIHFQPRREVSALSSQ